jgi:hypothetical protein
MELGCVSAVTREGRIIWVADAHRDDGKRFVVHADEKLTAFLDLEEYEQEQRRRNTSTSEIRFDAELMSALKGSEG